MRNVSYLQINFSSRDFSDNFSDNIFKIYVLKNWMMYTVLTLQVVPISTPFKNRNYHSKSYNEKVTGNCQFLQKWLYEKAPRSKMFFVYFYFYILKTVLLVDLTFKF